VLLYSSHRGFSKQRKEERESVPDIHVSYTGLTRTRKRALILNALDSAISEEQVLPVLTVEA